MIKNLSKNSLSRLLLTVLVLAVSIAPGCSKSDSPVPAVKPAAPATVPAQPAKPVQQVVSSVARLAPAPLNQFDFSNKKDPFKPYVVPKLINGTSRHANGIRSSLPIHSFDISQFKLIGILSGGKENIAQVLDPNGKTHILKVGRTIGKNEGRIISISGNNVEITEQFRDDNGRVRKENIKLTLPRKQ